MYILIAIILITHNDYFANTNESFEYFKAQ